VYNFTVIENYATPTPAFDEAAAQDRLQQYRQALRARLGGALAAESRVVVRAGALAATGSGRRYAAGPEALANPALESQRFGEALARNRRRAADANCDAGFTPVTVEVYLSEPVDPAWVQSLVEEAGTSAVNNQLVTVHQCAPPGDVSGSVVTADVQLVEVSPPPPPPPSPPPATEGPNVALLFLPLAGLFTICAFFSVGVCFVAGARSSQRKAQIAMRRRAQDLSPFSLFSKVGPRMGLRAAAPWPRSGSGRHDLLLGTED
jgi:hypothetical protein